jgi:type IV pilus assembly protein PilE
MKSRNARTSGFTLIELMIVVTIAAILFAVAVPTYQSQIRHSRRTDAKTALQDLAVREAKYFTQYNSFTATPANLGYSGTFPQNVGSNYYQIYVCPGSATGTSSTSTPCTATATLGTGTSFVVAAIPNAGTSQANDSSCQYYAVDNTGTQFATDTTAGTGGNDTTATCWQ